MPVPKRLTAAAAVVLLTVTLATTAGAPAGAAPPGPPGPPAPDEIRHSPNIRHLATVAKQPPFDAELAFGTDLAFAGDLAAAGNYDGFTLYDIADPARPRILSQTLCPGSQNDVSIAGDLLFLSTDSSRSDDSCRSTPLPATAKTAWEGIKIFDIGDPAAPRYLAAVETACGSHTHTLVPEHRRDSVLLYVSSYGPDPAFPDCLPPHDRITVVRVPLRDPAAAAVVARPVLFPGGGHPGRPGEFPGPYTVPTSGCHDITVLPERDLAAAACMGDGVLLDISDRLRPRPIDRVRDRNFAFWHSATFNDDATKVVFVDELGGGMTAACAPEIGATRGASAIYDIVGGRLRPASYFKIDRPQGTTENCVAHNSSLIPVRGRDVLVQAFYQGGVSVWDFTDSRRPREIGYFERGPLPADQVPAGGSWSAYWYNGHIYSSDMRKGLDVLRLDDPRTASANRVRLPGLNPQTQPSYRR